MKTTRIAVVTAVILVLVVGTIALVMRKRSSAGPPARIAATMNEIQRVNASLPERQTEAKMLIMSAVMQRKIPEAASWCDAVNVGGKIWPVTPTNTVFAINDKLAGRTFARTIPGDAVVFFETAKAGWNQAGGVELLASRSDGAVVALADGMAVMVSPSEAAQLRWQP